MVAYAYRMPKGIPGNLSRTGTPTIIEAQPYDPSLPFSAYGLPGKIAGGQFVPISTSTDVVYGFLVRPFPITGANASDPLGTSVPPLKGLADVLRLGYIQVKCNAGTPALGGTVYVRYANGATGTPVGGIEATSVSGSNVAIPNCQFQDAADSGGNVEISFGGPGI